jgi:hypothetical protein
MPAIDNPLGMASSFPGQLAALQRVVKDLSANATYSPSTLTVGTGGLTVNGPTTIAGATTLTGGVTGPVAATGALSGTTVTGTGAISGASLAVTGAAAAASLTTTGDVTANGNLNTLGTLTAPTGINSLGAYNNLLTSGYRGLWVTTPTGAFGYVPSSRRFKQDETPANVNLAAALAMQVVNFRYKQAVIDHGTAAAIEWGVIAEDLDALGFTWLVDYDDTGLPFGVKTEKIIFAFIPVIQNHERRLTAGGL